MHTACTVLQIRKLSVKQIVTPVTADPFGNALPGGLYDPAMGPQGSDSSNCETCKLQASVCPGHFGHIDLPVPVYNPLFLKYGPACC
jgi:DNA-directed RNA polymerase I subunit RPA1